MWRTSSQSRRNAELTNGFLDLRQKWDNRKRDPRGRNAAQVAQGFGRSDEVAVVSTNYAQDAGSRVCLLTESGWRDPILGQAPCASARGRVLSASKAAHENAPIDPGDS